MTDIAPRGPLSLAWNIPHRLPDELLYSYIARMHALSGYSAIRDTTRVLFGVPYLQLMSGLPTHLNALGSLLANTGISVEIDQLLHDMTLYDYYAHFLNAAHRKRLRQRMLESNGGLKLELGLLASRLGAATPLRYCTACGAEDEAALGFRYWRRAHQLPCVAVCAKHYIRLITYDKILFRWRLELPPDAISDRGLPVTSEEMTNDVDPAEIRLSTWSAAMLKSPLPEPDLARRHHFYVRTIQAHGFAHGTMRIHPDELNNSIRHSNSNYAFLSAISAVDISSVRSGYWVPKLYRAPRGVQHPLYHILLLAHLFDSPQQYLASYAQVTNSVTDTPSVTTETTIKASTEKILKYVLSGLSIRAAAIKAGVSVNTAVTIARLHNLSFVRRTKIMSASLQRYIRALLLRGERCSDIASKAGISVASVYRVLNSDSDLKSKVAKKRAQNSLKIHRNQLRRLLLNGTAPTASAIRLADSGLYIWLVKHDKAWLSASLQPAMRAPRKRSTLLWRQRDAQLAKEIATAAQLILTIPGKPIQLTTAALARRSSLLRRLQKQIDKLPRTQELLRDFVESDESFRVRKLQWSFSSFSKDESLPGFSKVFRRACINDRYSARMREIFNALLVQARKRQMR